MFSCLGVVKLATPPSKPSERHVSIFFVLITLIFGQQCLLCYRFDFTKLFSLLAGRPLEEGTNIPRSSPCFWTLRGKTVSGPGLEATVLLSREGARVLSDLLHAKIPSETATLAVRWMTTGAFWPSKIVSKISQNELKAPLLWLPKRVAMGTAASGIPDGHQLQPSVD